MTLCSLEQKATESLTELKLMVVYGENVTEVGIFRKPVGKLEKEVGIFKKPVGKLKKRSVFLRNRSVKTNAGRGVCTIGG